MDSPQGKERQNPGLSPDCTILSSSDPSDDKPTPRTDSLKGQESNPDQVEQRNSTVLIGTPEGTQSPHQCSCSHAHDNILETLAAMNAKLQKLDSMDAKLHKLENIETLNSNIQNELSTLQNKAQTM